MIIVIILHSSIYSINLLIYRELGREEDEYSPATVALNRESGILGFRA